MIMWQSDALRSVVLPLPELASLLSCSIMFFKGLASKVVCDVLRRPLTYSLGFMCIRALVFRST
ncbi:hypothetical protein HanRHA438_Chr14g0634741 [Helianthus annuus]|nr:hypothetical protein HanRHA438_Chr14g0634741 [Helianthus annuus]